VRCFGLVRLTSLVGSVGTTNEEKREKMRKLWKIATIAVLAANAAGLSHAEGRQALVSGNSLLALLRDNSRAGEVVALAYIKGVLDEDGAWEVFDTLEKVKSGNRYSYQHLCLPKGVDDSQLIDVTRSYLINHPEIRTGAANQMVRSSLADAFPCR